MRVKCGFMNKVLILLSVFTLLVGCGRFDRQRSKGVVVECNGERLTTTDLEVLTLGLSSVDSARVAEQYIRQWAIHVLMQDAIRQRGSKDIERLVADYRRSLYQHEWEHHLVAQKMPQYVEDSVVQSYYLLHKSHYVLAETILRGVLLVVPHGAPNMEELKRIITHPEEEENIEWLEKYAYQYASGYELFLDDWKSVSQVLLYMPSDDAYVHKQLSQKKQIVVQDSVNSYILQVTDIHARGEQMPLEYARDEIEETILSQRQVAFIQAEREALYEKAVQHGKLKRYEK